jgi:hypothetical protein
MVAICGKNPSGQAIGGKIDRAEDAAAIDSPERRQALDLGRIARELLAENSRRLGEVEAGVRAVTFGP